MKKIDKIRALKILRNGSSDLDEVVETINIIEKGLMEPHLVWIKTSESIPFRNDWIVYKMKGSDDFKISRGLPDLTSLAKFSETTDVWAYLDVNNAYEELS